MSFKQLRDQCLKAGVLFEDPDFPATNRSIYYSKVDRNIVWRRPRDLIQNPKFVVGGKSRFDLYQGGVGNCWYIAAVATIATRPELFQRVVPEDQGFGDDYAGIFHFYFWRYGQWVEVVVDDQLPTHQGRTLVFCHNREERNEFWAALLEKAYAKIHASYKANLGSASYEALDGTLRGASARGCLTERIHASYEALDGGWTEDALVDFTGGIGQRMDLKNKSEIPGDLYNTMLHDHSMNSLMGSSMQATKDTMESELPNGLVIGHAYSFTKVALVPDKQGNRHRLLRLRNPWGQKEWKGAWSDRSKTWLTVEDEVRQRIRINDENGEFWMSYEDWSANFDELQLCHLPPDNRMKEKRVWRESPFHGEWVRGVSAGGCGNPPDRELYWTNPQYAITLRDPDEDDNDKKCTFMVSLMQKYSRRKRSVNQLEFANVAMSFDLYKVKSHATSLLDGESYSKRALQLARKGTQYQYFREITQSFRLEPGNYVVIPSLFDANRECMFLLRCYTEHDPESISEMDIVTEPIMLPRSADDVIQELFFKYAGEDRVVDARELRLILNEGYQKELGVEQEFELEACRSMLSMMDENKSGVLEWNELRKMWAELNLWRDTFKQFDKDSSGYIDVRELRVIFKSIGYNLSKRVLAAVVRRYGGKEGKLAFNDFIIVITKMAVHLNIFTDHSKDGLKGKAKFYLDDYMEVALYF